jgi:hypothetical protein
MIHSITLDINQYIRKPLLLPSSVSSRTGALHPQPHVHLHDAKNSLPRLSQDSRVWFERSFGFEARSQGWSGRQSSYTIKTCQLGRRLGDRGVRVRKKGVMFGLDAATKHLPRSSTTPNFLRRSSMAGAINISSRPETLDLSGVPSWENAL